MPLFSDRGVHHIGWSPSPASWSKLDKVCVLGRMRFLCAIWVGGMRIVIGSFFLERPDERDVIG